MIGVGGEDRSPVVQARFRCQLGARDPDGAKVVRDPSRRDQVSKISC